MKNLLKKNSGEDNHADRVIDLSLNLKDNNLLKNIVEEMKNHIWTGNLNENIKE